MRKLYSFLLSLLFLSIIFVSTNQISKAETGTQVNGIISTNTSWLKANSPYTLTGAIGIQSNITLTIEAGSVVNLANYYIQVNGTLICRGNADYPIQLNNGEIKFTQLCNSWNEQTGLGCIIENTNLNSTNVDIVSSSPKINANNFTNNGQNSNDCLRISESSSLISNNTFLIPNQGSGYCIFVKESNASIILNRMAGGYCGIFLSCSFFQTDNIICSPLIEKNLITGCGTGIEIQFNNAAPVIQNNTITENGEGIHFSMLSVSYPIIIFNNIYNNTLLNIDLSDGMGSGCQSNINATYNWWGTTNAESINQTIYDIKNDFNLGSVNFGSFLLQANPEAPIPPTFIIQASSGQGGSISPDGVVNVSYGIRLEFTITPNDGYKLGTVLVDNIPTTSFSYPFPMGSSNKVYYTFEQILSNHTIQASFESLASPTANPTQSPTNNPTQQPTIKPSASPTQAPTPTPTVPEIPSILMLTILMITLTVGTLFHRKQKNHIHRPLFK